MENPLFPLRLQPELDQAADGGFSKFLVIGSIPDIIPQS
jgi:hypothetical protein